MRCKLLLLVWAAASPVFAADCATRKYPFTQDGDRIYVKAGSGITDANKSMLSEAVSAWNNSCTGEGSDFPRMYTSSTSGYTVTVNFVDGPGVRCGTHEASGSPEPTSSVITIYKTYNGSSCAPYSDTLAHELGHVYGLGEAEDPSGACAHTIMGGRAPGETRVITSEVCNQVAENWLTEEEQYQEDLSQCESDCPYPCTGNPPVCDTSIDTSGGWQCPFSQCSPLILDLNGDGIHTTSADEPVSFDLTGDGAQERMGWTNPTTEEAFLWLDLDRNGRVDDGRELFGHGTVLENGTRAQDGFEALAQYDLPALGGNADGKLSTEDRAWQRLRLWDDANHDGVCTPDESGPIAEYGVIDIDLAYTAHPEVDPSGNAHRLRSSYRRMVRGGGRPTIVRLAMHDVFFRSLP